MQWAYAQRHRALLARYKRQGLTVGENFISYAPLYISEPYMVMIGNNVAISGNVTFITHDAAGEHLARIGVSDGRSRLGRIAVHDDSGIGYGAMILPGVSIGPRSIVGAGAVVRNDVPPDTVVVGNPARIATTVPRLAAGLEADVSNVAAFLRAWLVRRWPGRFSADSLADDVPFDSAGLGLDSVEVVEVVLACEDEYGTPIPETALTSGPLTIRRLAEQVTVWGARPLRDLGPGEHRA